MNVIRPPLVRSPLALCALVLAALLSPVANAADTDIPAILQFAERYRSAADSLPPEPVATKEVRPSAPRPREQKNPPSAWRLDHDRQLQALEQALQRQKVLEQENQHLKQPIVQLDVAGALSRGFSALRRQLTVPPLPMAARERTPDREALSQPEIRQDYAAGVSLGSEILRMQSEHQRWGIASDKTVILAGIRDLFAGSPRLNRSEVNETLAEVDRVVAARRQRTQRQQADLGQARQAEFMRQKGSRAATMGYWYNIDYRGSGNIAADALVEVAVKEMRVDGKVIQDMDAGGALLSQRLNEFPPVFRDALSQLENHGSITLLVPPGLAYGEAGYPPDIPPGAWMLYKIRIADVFDEKTPIVKRPTE